MRKIINYLFGKEDFAVGRHHLAPGKVMNKYPTENFLKRFFYNGEHFGYGL